MYKTEVGSRWLKRLGRSAIVAALLVVAWAGISGPSRRAAARDGSGARSNCPVLVGQSFVVTVAIENVQNLGAFEFEFNFNPAVASATVDDIQLASLLGSTGRTTGVLRLARRLAGLACLSSAHTAMARPAGPNGSGVLATVTMSAAVSPGTSQLSLSGLKVTNVAGEEVLALTTAGSVTVGRTTPRTRSICLYCAQQQRTTSRIGMRTHARRSTANRLRFLLRPSS